MGKTIVDAKTGNSYRIEFKDGSSSHRLVNTLTGTRTEWASYRQFTYLEGYVGATCFFLREEAILTADEFCALCGVR